MREKTCWPLLFILTVTGGCRWPGGGRVPSHSVKTAKPAPQSVPSPTPTAERTVALPSFLLPVQREIDFHPAEKMSMALARIVYDRLSAESSGSDACLTLNSQGVVTLPGGAH